MASSTSYTLEQVGAAFCANYIQSVSLAVFPPPMPPAEVVELEATSTDQRTFRATCKVTRREVVFRVPRVLSGEDIPRRLSSATERASQLLTQAAFPDRR